MMGIHRYLFQWLFLMFLLFPTSINSKMLPNKPPNLSLRDFKFLHGTSNRIVNLSADYEFGCYEQTLDHFNFQSQSFATFNQTYVINRKYWGGSNSSSPIFAYLGFESALYGFVGNIGPLVDNAQRLKSLQVYIEHRFYGNSTPFELTEEAMLKNESIRGYFTSAQALADYAEILLHVKQIVAAPKSPIIVVGGSYGGMLAAWFRLKYPHIAIGALAISAPLLYFENITPHDAYYAIVQKDFKEQSESCFETIEKSYDLMDEIASEPDGFAVLSKKFNTCSPLTNVEDLSQYLGAWYSQFAQESGPGHESVHVFCEGIDGAPGDDDVLDRISAGFRHYFQFFNLTNYCKRVSGYSNHSSSSWNWQTCSDMVIPLGGSSNVTLVRQKPFSFKEKIKECKENYGVFPRPCWATTYYGGHDIKLVLRKFGSNIIFTNGLRDPWCPGGVLENLSDSLVAITTKNGTHCTDLDRARDNDPEWLKDQKNKTVQIMEKWLTDYYAHLNATEKIN